MSDEALNAHLDWLDKCAKEQGSERMMMKLSERMYKHGDTEDFTSIKAVYKWATEVAQLEAELARAQKGYHPSCLVVDERVAQLEDEIENLETQLSLSISMYEGDRSPMHKLEAENAKLKRVTKGVDLQGWRSVATELAKREKPFSFPSLWRDTGTRQRRIGRQLLRLVDALLTAEEQP